MNANRYFSPSHLFVPQPIALILLSLSLTVSVSAQERPDAKPQPPPEGERDQRLEQIQKQIQELKKTVDDLLRLPTSTSRRSDTNVTPDGDAASTNGLTTATSSARRNTNDPIARIREEGLSRSQVMQTLSYLTDVIGPRLTGSPNLKHANQWTRDKLSSWGLTNAHLEAWGPFGRGWSLKRFSAQIIEPYTIPLIGFPKAWSPGFEQPVVASVIYLDAQTEADLEKYKGKLKDAIVLIARSREVRAHFEPLAVRQSETNLLRLANAPPPGANRGGAFGGPGRSGRGRGGRGLVAGDNAAPANAGPGRRGGRGGAAPAGPYLGITGEDSAGGARLTSVLEEGPAGRAGLKADDLIVAVGGKAIDRFEQLVEAISSSRVGDKLHLEFQRGTQTQQVEVTLAERPPAGVGANLPGRILSLLLEEKAALAVSPSGQGDGGTLFVQSVTLPGGGRGGGGGNPNAPRYYSTNAPATPPQMTLAVEDYNRLVRMVQQGEKLKMAVDLQAEFHDDDLMAYNTVAEIPGSDLRDEVVMLGAHMDSWHSGTGATDNGAGVAAAMEAVRIITALDLKPRRTIRVGLWTGEEQGLLGSRAYVAKHFGYYTNITNAVVARVETDEGSGGTRTETAPANPRSQRSLVRQPEYEQFSAYFNLDNGTGKIRGIYMQGNEAVRPIFRQWLEPFADLGAQTLTLSNTGGTDHQSFDGIGLPGFQFIQDPLEYNSRTHHSNADVFDRIQADDMKQAATILAAFAYNAGMLDGKLPRKPTE